MAIRRSKAEEDPETTERDRAQTDLSESESTESLEQQLSELQKETAELADTLTSIQAQRARDEAVMALLRDIRATNASVRAAATSHPPPVVIEREQGVVREESRDCGGGSCDCVSQDCCSFEIRMTYVRVLAMQPVELADSNANPWAELEIRMFAYLDGYIGSVIPSMFSTMSVKKLAAFQGIKNSVGRTIGTVSVRKGKSKTITIGCDVIEEDAGLAERVTGGRDEEGSNTATMILDCCCASAPTLAFDVHFTSGGLGMGAIEVGFDAVKKC